MVLIADLDADRPGSHAQPDEADSVPHALQSVKSSNDGDDMNAGADGASKAVERPNPNLNGFSAALSCYP